jgi:hypothetical protein
MPFRRLYHTFSIALLFHLLWPTEPASAAAPPESIEEPVLESVRIRQDTQQQEEQWRAEKQALLLRYEELRHKRDHLSDRRRDVTAAHDAARRRIAEKQRELDDIEQIQREITPLIDELVADLQRFVAEDLPFLPDERRQRLDRLLELTADPAISVSEQFRKAMEALLIETEYGATIEVYQQTIRLDNRDLLVNVFRLGRIALFYQSIDTTACGYFNVATANWQELPAHYNRAIETAMDIGAKRRPAELLTLPLGRIQLQ